MSTHQPESTNTDTNTNTDTDINTDKTDNTTDKTASDTSTSNKRPLKNNNSDTVDDTNKNNDEENEGNDKNTNNDGDGGIYLAGKEYTCSKTVYSDIFAMVPKDQQKDHILHGFVSFLVFSILERHPRFAEKMKGGVESIGYGINNEYDEETRCFFVLHPATHEKTYFSLRKAINEVFEHNYSLPPPRKRHAPVIPANPEQKKKSHSAVNSKKFLICQSSDENQALPPVVSSIKEDLQRQGCQSAYIAITGKKMRIEFRSEEDCSKALEQVKQILDVPVSLRPLSPGEITELSSRPQFTFGKGKKMGKNRKGGKEGKHSSKNNDTNTGDKDNTKNSDDAKLE